MAWVDELFVELGHEKSFDVALTNQRTGQLYVTS